jgi:hypothetical protein
MRRGWSFVVLLAALIGLAAPPLAVARGAGQAFGTDKPFVDTSPNASKALVRQLAARTKPAAAMPTGTTSGSPQAVGIVPNFGVPSFVIAVRPSPARRHDVPAPAYRIAAQPRAPPASRA